MPIFVMSTNVKEVPTDFKRRVAEALAASLNKQLDHIAVQVNTSQNISFAGSDEPAALCDLTSIGSLSPEANKRHSKVLMELFQENLKVKPTRVFILFHDKSKADIGFNKTTIDG